MMNQRITLLIKNYGVLSIFILFFIYCDGSPFIEIALGILLPDPHIL